MSTARKIELLDLVWKNHFIKELKRKNKLKEKETNKSIFWGGKISELRVDITKILNFQLKILRDKKKYRKL